MTKEAHAVIVNDYQEIISNHLLLADLSGEHKTPQT